MYTCYLCCIPVTFAVYLLPLLYMLPLLYTCYLCCIPVTFAVYLLPLVYTCYLCLYMLPLLYTCYLCLYMLPLLYTCYLCCTPLTHYCLSLLIIVVHLLPLMYTYTFISQSNFSLVISSIWTFTIYLFYLTVCSKDST